MWLLIATVALWWVAKTIASIASKSVMGASGNGNTSWTPAIRDLRWMELTALQHLLGGTAAVIWLKVVMGKSIWPTDNTHKMEFYIAALGNVTGNLATNAAYALVSSSVTQVVKACEPLFTFAFSMLLYKNYETLNLSTLLSIIVMVAGATGYVLWDTTFNVWGLAAAIGSNIAFPIRNIYLKKMDDSQKFEKPLQKYAAISVYGVLFLLPILVIKFALTQALSMVQLKEGVVSCVFHFMYNLASITVLQSVSPLTHAVLNLLKRVFVIVANIVFFHTPLSWKMFVGFCALFLGLYLYQTAVRSKRKWISLKTFLPSVGILLLLLAVSSQSKSSKSIPSSIPSCIPSLTVERRITTAWVFERPIPHNVVMNIESIADQNPDVPVYVYCGTTQCINAITELDSANIITRYLVVSDVVRGTPLEYWLARHPLNKVLAGRAFEKHLHEAVRLGLLWAYGGIYVDSAVRVTGRFTFPECQSDADGWVSNSRKVLEEVAPGLLDASYFPPNHPFIRNLSELYIETYPREGNSSAFHFNFQEKIRKSFSSMSCASCLTVADNQLQRLDTSGSRTLDENTHFGTLSYGSIHNVNLGDEIQAFPGLQYLPFVDFFIERDDLKRSEGKEQITVFFNAWWGSERANWPPPSNIHPIMLSIHIDGGMQTQWEHNMDYLEGRGPIGCLDHATLDLLRLHGIEAYFSGCLTLLMNNPNVKRKRTDNIYLVDVKSVFSEYLPSDIQERAISVKHSMSDTKIVDRFKAAHQLMEMYGSAKLVITQRIHSALPCVAMGTPVIFINAALIPKGEWPHVQSSSQTVGLLSLFHTLDLRTKSKVDAKDWLQNFPWDKPPPNPNIDLMMRLRATAWNVIRQNQALYDSARKLGAIPMSSPETQSDVSTSIFHLVFTTLKHSTIKLVQGGGSTHGSLNWRQWRCIESIFHHHPLAEVIVHSNILLQSEFDVLTEAGYSVKVQSYSLVELLEASPAQNFTERLEEVRKGQYWYSHEADLLRLLVQYKWGGVYVDTDVILVKPVDSLQMNTLAWQDPNNISLSGAFMKFEKGNLYLKTCLNALNIAEQYSATYWGGSGPSLLTRIWKNWKGDSGDVHVMHRNKVNMFYFSDLKTQCNTETRGKRFKFYVNIINEEAYAVRLRSEIEGMDSKLKKGTICSHLLNSYCVLCNIMY